MTQRYLGGIMTATPTDPSGSFNNSSASGMWTLQEALGFHRAGDWPDPTNVPAYAFVKTASFDIERFIINTTGNAVDFAHATTDEKSVAGFGNNIYAFWAGGDNTIDRLTNASGGTATDFGDMTQAGSGPCGISNNVRGIIVGGDRGSPDNFTVIEYVTMATTGNATDFGDTNVAAQYVYGLGKGSTTRGVFGAAGTDGGASGPTNAMSYITIASAGDSEDFGDLTTARIRGAAGNNSTRIVFSGGQVGNEVATNVMDYITIASTGNATDFGDTTETRMNLGGASSDTRTVFTGGAGTSSSGSRKKTIDYITTATTGNAIDFGDLTANMEYTTANSSANPSQQNETFFPPAAIGLFSGGVSPGRESIILYVNITTDGESGLFGDLLAKTNRVNNGSCGSSTRGIVKAGGTDDSGNVDSIEFIGFSTKGKSTDFGNLAAAIKTVASLSTATRGVFAGGIVGSTNQNVIQYITIANTGNSTDFGDLTQARINLTAASNATRGVFANGAVSDTFYNVLEYITVASTGNATDFGDTSNTFSQRGSVASATRMVIGGGQQGENNANTLEYITIASTGNATDFGDITSTARHHTIAVNNSTLGLFNNYSSSSINIDKITIASTGNATDWGDLIVQKSTASGTSNSHGGIA